MKQCCRQCSRNIPAWFPGLISSNSFHGNRESSGLEVVMDGQSFYQLMFRTRLCQTALATLTPQSLDAEWSITVFLGELDGTWRGVDTSNVKAPLSRNGACRLLQIAEDFEG